MILEEKFVRHIKKILQKIIKNNPWYKLPYAIPIGLLRDVIYYVCTYFFNIFIKENKNKKPIIGFSNLYYTGNPRAVFEYMLKNEHNYEIYWLAPNSKSIKDVEKAGGKAFNYKDLFGIPYFLKTDIWVVAHKGYDIPFLPHKNYKIIQLWHGVGEKHVQHSQKEFEKYDVWCSPSEYIKQKHVELWKVPKEKFYVTGYARMDMLYKYLKKPKQELLQDLGIETSGKIILYTPTYNTGLCPWGNAYEEFEKLCIFCNKNNLTLILRMHPYAKIDRDRVRKIIDIYDNVFWLDMPEEPDTMKLLAVADILINVRSSTSNEYFLTKRPIIYLEGDGEFFEKTTGKTKIPNEFRAGEVVSNDKELYNSLKTILEYGNKYIEKQEKYLKIIHGNVNGKASENVVKIIENISKK